MNIEKHRAFIESLEGEKGLPEEWRLLTPRVDKFQAEDRILFGTTTLDVSDMEVLSGMIGKPVYGYVIRRAESRQIPDLKEKVKELVRDAMDVVAPQDINMPKECREYWEFRALCEPEKDSKEAAR